MLYSTIGNYSLFLGLIFGLVLFYFSVINFRNSKVLDTKILSFTFLQFFLVVISFLSLVLSFVISDFSNETVFNNSHTTKPIFYKIAGTWGNHEGSLLLWLLVLTLFILCDFADSAFSEFKDPNFATNFLCSLVNWTFVIKYSAEKLKSVKLKADNT